MDASKQSGGTELDGEKALIPTSGTRGATGPRTKLGKLNASRNATKHGIFSKAVLLNGDCSRQYKQLWSDLRAALQPVGALEDLLVETLATTAWRKRRLLITEAAEIRMNTEFLDWGALALERLQ